MSNMIKRSLVKVEGSEKLMIDSNRLVNHIMEEIASAPPPTEPGSDPEGFEEFTEGIVADRVEMLVGEQVEGEEAAADAPSNVIGNADPGPGVQQMAEEALAAARAEADSIVAEANEQAQAILSEAEQNAAAALESAKSEGFNAGHDEGYNAGLQEAEAIKAEYQGMIESLENEYQKKMDELEPVFVDALTDIYEHIFHVSLADKKEVIFHLIQDAVRKVEGNEGFIIHVSKDDFGYVSMQKQELLGGVTNGDDVEIVEDMTLKSNECFIETGGGIFDCSLETQLEGLKRELRLLSYEKPSDGTGSNG
ncbi:MAG: hypothetical protein K5668_00495 [Lachnospiraceae bacterium]|nr:hypothetical protein [Lachnospiraceae bacterium]